MVSNEKSYLGGSADGLLLKHSTCGEKSGMIVEKCPVCCGCNHGGKSRTWTSSDMAFASLSSSAS